VRFEQMQSVVLVTSLCEVVIDNNHRPRFTADRFGVCACRMEAVEMYTMKEPVCAPIPLTDRCFRGSGNSRAEVDLKSFLLFVNHVRKFFDKAFRRFRNTALFF
jgi:hypothetical protein